MVPILVRPDVLGLIIIAVMVSLAIMAYEIQVSARPVYRPGCYECKAEAQRILDEQKESAHNMQHRGVKAPGMPPLSVDRWDCDDPSCPRNRRWK